jgi:pyruvate/2-oxoglutarate/acetoin dehydrogenase E1 component
MNQLVNHLDKIREMTENKMQPKVIIRVAVGSKKPFSAGPQHTQDHTEAMKLMLTDIDVVTLNESEDIFPTFQNAYERTDGKSTLIIEYADYYGTK